VEPNKEHILPFVLFLLKKSAAHRIICETYGENAIVIRTCAKWFKRFENGDISDKECSGTPYICARGRIAERWEKIMDSDGKYFD